MPTDDLVLVEVADEVATVTLNRPDARNALNRALRKALPATLAEVDQRHDVAAIVLTGADPAFCAGLDLKEIAATGQAPGATPDTRQPEHARGLVNHVVPHADLLGFAQGLARDIASVPRPAVARMMATYDEGSLRDGAGAWALEAEVSNAWMRHGLDPAEFERTRQAVMQRGRTQI